MGCSRQDLHAWGAASPRGAPAIPTPAPTGPAASSPALCHSPTKPSRSVKNKKNPTPKPPKNPKTKPRNGEKARKPGVGTGARDGGGAGATHLGHEAVRPAARTQYGSGGMCQGAAAPCAAAAAAAAPPSPPPHGNREQPTPPRRHRDRLPAPPRRLPRPQGRWGLRAASSVRVPPRASSPAGKSFHFHQKSNLKQKPFFKVRFPFLSPSTSTIIPACFVYFLPPFPTVFSFLS